MASSVFYRFKSQRDESRITFDGTGISVFDLKKEIILANNLSKATDYDLHLYTQSGDEYKDDTQVIPRSTSVIAKRMPAARPGRGSSTKYITADAGAMEANSSVGGPGSMGPPSWQRTAMSRRFDGKEETPVVASKPAAPIATNIATGDEAAAIAAMFQAQDANWDETQEKMSHATYVHRGGARGGRPTAAGPNHQQAAQNRFSDRPLPPSYVCYRCGQKGHWIQDCPTNNDKEFDNRPRIKRTTGIPRSFLKTVENPGTNTQGVMVTPEGGFVVAQPDVASWQKQLSKRTKILTEAEVRERQPSDRTLTCPIDKKLFRDAMQTPCCYTAFCEDCIQSHLLEHDFVCPNCSRKVPGLDKLRKDTEARTKVAAYIEQAIEDSKNTDETMEGPSDGQGGASELMAALGENAAQNGGDASKAPNMPQIIADSVPQLQEQVQQLARMLQNSSLPADVRQRTETQHQQLQLQLQGAQAVAMALAASQTQVTAPTNVMPGMGDFALMNGAGYMNGGGWSNQFVPQGAVNEQDSAYQRLPVNNRRRNLKRERPSDFVEIGGVDGEVKQPRYWE